MDAYLDFCRWVGDSLSARKGCLLGAVIDLGLMMLWMFVSTLFLSFAILFVFFWVIRSIVRGVFRFIKWVYRKIRKEPTPKPSAVYYDEQMTGLEYEHYCAKRLAEEGFYNLVVTSESGDYGADIIGYDLEGRKICVQCKKYDSTVDISAIQEILGAKQYYQCDRAMVVTTSSFTKAALRLADSGRVELRSHYC